ncbi:MAG: glycosyltransferase family 2 protein [Myxococcota bacterium]
MLIALSLLLALALTILGLALSVRGNVPVLAKLQPPPPKTWPKLSIIVPARDEASGIEAALASKLALAYPDLEVIAVDDRSSDETGAIIDRLAAADPRLRAVHVGELPEGWLGKLHALHVGLGCATGEWVLLSDADVHLAPSAMTEVIASAEAEAADMVAVFPKMHAVTPWIDAALSSVLLFLNLGGRVWSANDDRAPYGVGVGAFNLVRRRALLTTDALSVLKMEIADDAALGALIKSKGLRTRFYAGRERVHLVFMDSIGAMARSADKGGGMLGYNLWQAVILALFPVLLFLGLPLVGILLGGAAATLGGATLLVLTLAHATISVHYAAPLRGAILWPVGQLLNAAIALRTGVRTFKHQGVYWRGTFYSRQLLEAGRRLDTRRMRII